MDLPYRLQPIGVQIDRVDGLSRLEGRYPESWPPVELRPHALPSNTPSYYATPDLWPSNASSLQSYTYHSAVSSPSYSTPNSGSTWSSNMSFPYSVTSINSRKSRKNVLYPRRAHPPPLPLPPLLSPPSRSFSQPTEVPVQVELSHDVRLLFCYYFLRLYE